MSRFVAVASVVGLWVGLALSAGCQGPDEFFRLADAGQPGTGGSAPTGAGGTTGVAGTTGTGGTGGSATGIGGANGGATGNGGSNATGAAGAGSGTGGATGTGGAAGGRGGAGGSAGGAAGAGGRGGATSTGGATGAAGATGTAGSGSGTGGGAGTSSGVAGARGGAGGAAGAATGGRGGVTGTGGGAGGVTSTGGAGTGSGAGTSGGAGGGGGAANRIQVVAQCQSTNGQQDIRVTFRILNPESVAKQWSDIKVRYYFTPTMPLTPMVTFDFVRKFPDMLTATATGTYVEVGFEAGTGSVQGFDNVTGSDEIQLHLYNYTTTTWNTSQADDYSYRSCAGGVNMSAYTDRLTMPGYYQGQLAWGTEPPL